MTVQVEVHSTLKRAAHVCALAFILSALFVGAKKLRDTVEPQYKPSHTTTSGISSSDTLMIPVMILPVDDASRETKWLTPLAQSANGTLEVPDANGRIDVITDYYAFKVERMDKWREGIGQASQYGSETGKIPCLALIVDSDLWPLNKETIEKLRVVERTTLEQGIKLVVLRREPPKR